jgi:hypothetical protein
MKYEATEDGNATERGGQRLEGEKRPLDEPELVHRLRHAGGDPVEAPLQRAVREDARRRELQIQLS